LPEGGKSLRIPLCPSGLGTTIHVSADQPRGGAGSSGRWSRRLHISVKT
jgi:hypothetical protein